MTFTLIIVSQNTDRESCKKTYRNIYICVGYFVSFKEVCMQNSIYILNLLVFDYNFSQNCQFMMRI